jgi:hypothetical protein
MANKMLKEIDFEFNKRQRHFDGRTDAASMVV